MRRCYRSDVTITLPCRRVASDSCSSRFRRRVGEVVLGEGGVVRGYRVMEVGEASLSGPQLGGFVSIGVELGQVCCDAADGVPDVSGLAEAVEESRLDRAIRVVELGQDCRPVEV